MASKRRVPERGQTVDRQAERDDRTEQIMDRVIRIQREAKKLLEELADLRKRGAPHQKRIRGK